MEQSEIIREIHSIERDLHLNSYTIGGIPIWRIVRFSTRIHYINTIVKYEDSTSKLDIIGKRTVSCCSGFWKFFFRKNATIIFPFSRLVYDEQQYLDKFTDPIIEESGYAEKNYIIVDPPNYQGDYKRLHKKNTISNENRTIFRQILRRLFVFVFKLIQFKSVDNLFSSIKEPFKLPDNYINVINRKLALFFADYYYFKIWFSILKPKRVLLVYREAHFPEIAACKALSISTAEFQHGITLDDTTSYTGEYDKRIDPDYFLIFGDYWYGPQFGMPLERIIQVGWAYGNYIKKRFELSIKQPDNAVLVISSSEISEQILDALSFLSNTSVDVHFHIRQHPNESYDARLMEKLKAIPNAQVVSNKIDSAKVLPQYSVVIGENSSVLYEALSYGCKVGMLNICGLHAAINIPRIQDSFTIINKIEDFESFMSHTSNEENHNAFYSEFRVDSFKSFIEEKM